MKQQEKNKRALEIADELEQLGYSEVATKLREAVTSGKKSNESTTTTEGGESSGNEGDGEGGNGSNNPPHKPPFKKP